MDHVNPPITLLNVQRLKDMSICIDVIVNIEGFENFEHKNDVLMPQIEQKYFCSVLPVLLEDELLFS